MPASGDPADEGVILEILCTRTCPQITQIHADGCCPNICVNLRPSAGRFRPGGGILRGALPRPWPLVGGEHPFAHANGGGRHLHQLTSRKRRGSGSRLAFLLQQGGPRICRLRLRHGRRAHREKPGCTRGRSHQPTESSVDAPSPTSTSHGGTIITSIPWCLAPFWHLFLAPFFTGPRSLPRPSDA